MSVSFQMRTPPLFVIGLYLVLAAVSGCGGDGPETATGHVSGVVTLDGTAVDEGVVTFDDAAFGRGGSATLNGGAFQFDAPLNAGDYTVAIQPPPPPAPTAPRSASPTLSSAIPERYRQSASSGLTATVKEGVNVFEFKLVE